MAEGDDQHEFILRKLYRLEDTVDRLIWPVCLMISWLAANLVLIALILVGFDVVPAGFGGIIAFAVAIWGSRRSFVRARA
jgi:hypothetical protein